MSSMTDRTIVLAGGGVVIALLLFLLFVAVGADVYDYVLAARARRPGFIGNRWRR